LPTPSTKPCHGEGARPGEKEIEVAPKPAFAAAYPLDLTTFLSFSTIHLLPQPYTVTALQEKSLVDMSTMEQREPLPLGPLDLMLVSA
jgi:hypothetical protein